MRRLLVVIGLLVVFAMVPVAGAQGVILLNGSTSHIDISENSAHEKITLNYVVSQVGENAIKDSIYVYGTLSDVTVYDTEGALIHSENVEGGFTVITFNLRETLKAGDRSTVTIEFTKATSTVDTDLRYEIWCLWNTTPNSIQIIVALPEEYTLYKTSENASSTSVSDGKLQLGWSSVQENQFYTTVTFAGKSTVPENQEGEQPAVTSPLSYVFLLLAAAASLATTGAFLKVRPLKPRVKIPRKVKRPRGLSKEDVRRMLVMLTSHERKVVNVLIRKDNLTQQALCDRTGIPKATMSRVLQRLENKGIVSRAGYGASKRVLLTKWARRWRVK